jgi:hypothetical protein
VRGRKNHLKEPGKIGMSLKVRFKAKERLYQKEKHQQNVANACVGPVLYYQN